MYPDGVYGNSKTTEARFKSVKSRAVKAFREELGNAVDRIYDDILGGAGKRKTFVVALNKNHPDQRGVDASLAVCRPL